MTVLLLLGCLLRVALATAPPAQINLPPEPGGPLPPLLSQTGAFKDAARLIPSDGLLPYDLNVGFWSDGAHKNRWMALPNDSHGTPVKVGFRPTGDWSFPAGTIFVKHFELAVDEAHPDLRRRLETRLLVRTVSGSVYGVTYKWRPDNGDAELLATNLSEAIPIKTATGIRTQVWYYPSREDCRTCHTDRTGGVLGPSTRQLNRDYTYPDGTSENELRRWNRLGLFDSPLADASIPSMDCLARPDDQSRTLQDRARSFLDANCSNCHRPGGTAAYFDARYDTPIAHQGLIDGQVLINEGIDHARIIAPNDVWRSILFMRLNSTDALKMPPLAHNVRDDKGTNLVRRWIESLPGPPVLPPPTFSLAEGNYSGPIDLNLEMQTAPAKIHYTLDGSIPTQSDPVYEKPIHLSESTTVRAKAFETGYTRSITAQRTFIIGQ